MGTSYQFQSAVRPFVTTALVNSFKLAALAFIFCVPLAIFGGVLAALNYNGRTDRSISVAGLALLAVPEFVGCLFLMIVFGIWLNVLPIGATVGRRREPVHAGLPPDHSRGGDRLRAVRLHHAHGPGRHRRGAQRRLHPHGHPQGSAHGAR